jgi:hypothetical protein
MLELGAGHVALLNEPLRDDLDMRLVLMQKLPSQLAPGLLKGIALFLEEPLSQCQKLLEITAPGPIRTRVPNVLRFVACEATGDLLDEG